MGNTNADDELDSSGSTWIVSGRCVDGVDENGLWVEKEGSCWFALERLVSLVMTATFPHTRGAVTQSNEGWACLNDSLLA